MTKSIDGPKRVNGIGTFKSEDVMRGRISIKCRTSQTVIQQLDHQECKFVDLRVCNLNVGTLRGWSGEIAEMLERWSIDICFVQETIFRAKSVRMIRGNPAEYWQIKLLI